VFSGRASVQQAAFLVRPRRCAKANDDQLIALGKPAKVAIVRKRLIISKNRIDSEGSVSV